MGTCPFTKIPDNNRHEIRYLVQDYINICKDKIGLANKTSISNNSDPNEDDTCIYDPIDTEINDKPERDDPDTDNKEISDNNLNSSGRLFNKWFLSLYPTKVKKDGINFTLQEKGFHHTNDTYSPVNQFIHYRITRFKGECYNNM
ncbi:hypothetical protein H8356DRAFT_1388939 [Neocallimastix lanati (nom. inval.)]|nr:hypothetical protein H8356DRAFT_1388939 [Neocallimastix sp. JGI-2020a]